MRATQLQALGAALILTRNEPPKRVPDAAALTRIVEAHQAALRNAAALPADPDRRRAALLAPLKAAVRGVA